MNITIIGGDRRNLWLKEALEKDGHNVEIYGFNKYRRDTLDNIDTLDPKRVIIAGIPFAKDGYLHMPCHSGEQIEISTFLAKLTAEHVVIAGGIAHFDMPCKKYDILKNEDFLCKNALLTAEGIISTALSETNISMFGANVTIVGYGRVGCRAAALFKNIGANVTVIVDNSRDFAKASWGGFGVLFHADIALALQKSDVIVNTAPAKDPSTHVITREHMNFIDSNTLIIDISSKPYGVESCVKNRAKTLWIGNIPGKIAPKTGAIYIKTAVNGYLHTL